MRFKLFKAVSVMARNTQGGYDRLGGTASLDEQVNGWMADVPDARVLETSLTSTHLQSEDGSIAREVLYAIVYEEAETALPQEGRTAGPLRLV